MKIAVLGAGLMGRAIAWDLVRSEGIERVLLIDSDAGRLDAARKFAGDVEVRLFDVGDRNALGKVLNGWDVAVSCVPYRFNLEITKVCIEVGTHMCDLGGNNDVVDAQFALSEQAERRGVTIIPDCGLAPGMASVWAMAGVKALEKCESVKIRCGGLPIDPMPPFNYMKLFSMTGLINEYIEPCRILVDGEVAYVDGLSGLESIGFPQPFERMEAFYTSGGTSTLVKTLRDRVRDINYKTVRYPGHCELFRAMAAIGLTSSEPMLVSGSSVSPRNVLEALLDYHLTAAGADVTLLRVDCAGVLDGSPSIVRHQIVDYADAEAGLSSMQRCTGFPAAAVARMLGEGTIGRRGVVPQELVVLPDRLASDLEARGVDIERSVLRNSGQ